MLAHVGIPRVGAVQLAEAVRLSHEEGLSPHGGFLPPEIPLASLPGPVGRLSWWRMRWPTR